MTLNWLYLGSVTLIVLYFVDNSHQQIGKLDQGVIVKPSRLSALVLLDPPRYYDLNVDCAAGANLNVSNAKCGCSEFICLMNYKFNRLRSIQNCHETCCKRRSVKSAARAPIIPEKQGTRIVGTSD